MSPRATSSRRSTPGSNGTNNSGRANIDLNMNNEGSDGNNRNTPEMSSGNIPNAYTGSSMGPSPGSGNNPNDVRNLFRNLGTPSFSLSQIPQHILQTFTPEQIQAIQQRHQQLLLSRIQRQHQLQAQMQAQMRAQQGNTSPNMDNGNMNRTQARAQMNFQPQQSQQQHTSVKSPMANVQTKFPGQITLPPQIAQLPLPAQLHVLNSLREQAIARNNPAAVATITLAQQQVHQRLQQQIYQHNQQVQQQQTQQQAQSPPLSQGQQQSRSSPAQQQQQIYQPNSMDYSNVMAQRGSMGAPSPLNPASGTLSDNLAAAAQSPATVSTYIGNNQPKSSPISAAVQPQIMSDRQKAQLGIYQQQQAQLHAQAQAQAQTQLRSQQGQQQGQQERQEEQEKREQVSVSKQESKLQREEPNGTPAPVPQQHEMAATNQNMDTLQKSPRHEQQQQQQQKPLSSEPSPSPQQQQHIMEDSPTPIQIPDDFPKFQTVDYDPPEEKLPSIYYWSENAEDGLKTDTLLYEQILDREENYTIKHEEEIQGQEPVVINGLSNKEYISRLLYDLGYYQDLRNTRMQSIMLCSRNVPVTSIWGQGYSGYGNGTTNKMTEVIPEFIPRGSRKQFIIPDEGITRDGSSFRNTKEQLVPLRLDFDHDRDKFFLRDTFLWNKNESQVSLEEFVDDMLLDYRFDTSKMKFIKDTVLQSIREQLMEYQTNPYVELDQLRLGGDDRRIKIKLDIIVGQNQLLDQFEWDISNTENSPEDFAENLCQELQLPGEFVSAVAHSIREQVHMYHKSLALLGYAFNGSPVEDEDIKGRLLPAVTLNDVYRAGNETKAYTPNLLHISPAELERLDRDKDRDTRRKRRLGRSSRRGFGLIGSSSGVNLNLAANPGSVLGGHTSSSLNIPGLLPTNSSNNNFLAGSSNFSNLPAEIPLPDLSDIPRTFRTPVPSTLLPGGIDLGPSVDSYDLKTTVEYRSRPPRPRPRSPPCYVIDNIPGKSLLLSIKIPRDKVPPRVKRETNTHGGTLAIFGHQQQVDYQPQIQPQMQFQPSIKQQVSLPQYQYQNQFQPQLQPQPQPQPQYQSQFQFVQQQLYPMSSGVTPFDPPLPQPIIQANLVGQDEAESPSNDPLAPQLPPVAPGPGGAQVAQVAALQGLGHGPLQPVPTPTSIPLPIAQQLQAGGPSQVPTHKTTTTTSTTS